MSYSAPYTKEQLTTIARRLFAVIQQRSPEMPVEQAKAEAKKLAIEIFNAARSIAGFGKSEIDALIKELGGNPKAFRNSLPPQSSKQKSAKLKKIYRMSEELWELARHEQYAMRSEFNIDEDTFLHFLGGLDQFIMASEKAMRKGFKRGPDKKEELKEFVEITAIAFKDACGLTFKKIHAMPIKERRQWMGQYFALLKACMLEGHFQSYEALKKYAERYLVDNDPARENYAQ